ASETGRIARIAARHHVPGFGEAAAVEPVAARRGSVGLELAEARELLAGREVAPVDVPGDLLERGMGRALVGPVEVEHRLRARAAFFLIELPDLEEDPGEDLLVGQRLAGRLGRLVLPLAPARRVGERSVLLGEDRGRE